MIRRLVSVLSLSAVTAIAAAGGLPIGTASAAASPEPDGERQLVNLDSSTVVIYDDGRVYRRADMGDWRAMSGFGQAVRMAPPPPPGAFEWAVLSGDALDELLERVDALGLDEAGLDFGDPLITDSPTSTLVLHLGDEAVGHSVYAPRYSDGLTPEQAAARAAYNELRDLLLGLDDAFGDDLSAFEPYVPHEWVVTTVFYDPGDADTPWPLDTAPVAGECIALPSAADADTATGAYRTATMFVIADAALPNDPRCA